MTGNSLFEQLRNRITLDKEEGDIAFFNALSFELEYLTKIVTAAIVACIADDADRHRYGLEYALVRADSIGDWASVLNNALTGPSAQFFIPDATQITRDLTERVTEGNWRYAAVQKLAEVAQYFSLNVLLGQKSALRQFFDIGAAIRNRTRGHGAPTSKQCGDVCPLLEESLNLVIDNLTLFKQDWAYIHRNLSGKFKIFPLLGNCLGFEYLKRTRDEMLSNGVYIHIRELLPVRLVFSDPDLNDLRVPNGNFKGNSFETISYVTNRFATQQNSNWSNPPGRLPQSETHGRMALEKVGNTFANLPPTPSGHITRNRLETNLRDELLKSDRHPIITLTGPGGIGKTTLALAVIDDISRMQSSPYDVILWMSARDIDLLDSGPKPVTPRVVRKKDIADAAADLLEPSEWKNKNFQAEKYFEQCLVEGAAGKTLFVLDNFETLDSPADIFSWIDTYIRLPNKVLITTRFRDFAGDYPIEITGMTEEEALSLIEQQSRRLGISTLLTSDYKDSLINESDGHPYVIKILLGQVAREGRAVKPDRIVANADHLLTALFERTYENLSPAGQRVFLLLCSWGALVPAIAVEAVTLRPGNERFNVVSALSELGRFSLIEEIQSQADSEAFVGVPLAASSFGRRKLEVSPFKIAIEEDKKLLMEFGAGKKDAAHRGVLPRIDRLVKAAAIKASDNPAALDEFIPILEYLAARVPKVYLRLTDLVLEIGDSISSIERAKGYLRRFLETADTPEKMDIWNRLALLCHATDDVMGEVHALGEAALLPTATPEIIGELAKRINNKLRDLKKRRIEESWSPEVKQLIESVAIAMERTRSNLSATDYSSLSWLYLNIGMEDRARDAARRGIALEPENEHCLRLIRRLDS